MELWIRSQDREILKRINTEIYPKYDLSDYAKGYVYFLVSGGTKLGEYETKERALEVLDEINDILRLKFCSTLGTFKEVFEGYTEEQLKFALNQMSVYEMPKE